MPAPEGHPASLRQRRARQPVGEPAGAPAGPSGDEPGSPPGRRPAEPPPGPPASPPLGLVLARTAKEITRAFDDALAEAGGSQPVWLVLISLKTRRLASQRELADAVGIREATLTHHLNAMDASGLITRRRDPQNRRVHLVELTPAGEEAFYRMRKAAFAFNDRLRAGFSEAELAEFGRVLGQLRSNVTDGAGASAERPGG